MECIRDIDVEIDWLIDRRPKTEDWRLKTEDWLNDWLIDHPRRFQVLRMLESLLRLNFPTSSIGRGKLSARFVADLEMLRLAEWLLEWGHQHKQPSCIF